MNDKNLDFSKEIAEATKEIFSTMVMLEVENLVPVLTTSEVIDSNITSMLGLGGEIRGMLSIHCPEGLAKDITSSFLGMEVQELDEDVKDAIGEIANMVAGNLKECFTTNKINIELAIPTTIVGKSYKTSGLFGATQIIIPFLCGEKKFWVELKYILNS